MKALLVMAMLTGCSSTERPIGPDAQTQESALEIVWEGAFAMERESRPIVTWMGTCTPDRIGANATSGGQPVCWGETTTPARGVELQWTDATISDTKFVNGLYAWKVYLTTGAFKSYDAADVAAMAAANYDLVSFGL